MKQGEELKLAIKGKGFTMENAAKFLKVSRTTLYSYFDFDEMPLDILQNVKLLLGIHIETPEQDALLKGRGEGLLDGKQPYTRAPKGKVMRRTGQGEVPYYDADFEAGLGIDFYDDIRSEKPTYVMHIPDFAGCTAFPTYGRSFYPVIEPGAMLFATEEKTWQDGVEYGQIFGIVLHPVDGVRKRYLKRVRKSSRPETHFLLQSANPDYDDFELEKEKIKSMWLIHGWLNKNT